MKRVLKRLTVRELGLLKTATVGAGNEKARYAALAKALFGDYAVLNAAIEECQTCQKLLVELSALLLATNMLSDAGAVEWKTYEGLIEAVMLEKVFDAGRHAGAETVRAAAGP